MLALACPAGTAARAVHCPITGEGRRVSHSHAWQAAMETDAERTRQLHSLSGLQLLHPFFCQWATSLGQGLTPPAPHRMACGSDVALNWFMDTVRWTARRLPNTGMIPAAGHSSATRQEPEQQELCLLCSGLARQWR